MDDEKEQKNSKQSKMIIIILSIIAAITVGYVAISLTSLNGPSIPKELIMYDIAKDSVKDILVAPATAIFPDILEVTFKQRTENSWIIASYVDAQNKFGALLRNWWICELVETTNGGFYVAYVNLDDNLENISYRWYYVTSFMDYGLEAFETRNTSQFTITEDIWRIDWRSGGTKDYDYYDFHDLFIYVKNKNGDDKDIILITERYDSGTDYYTGKGTFYLEIHNFNIADWKVEIYQAEKLL